MNSFSLFLQIVEHEEAENYTLQIKFAQFRDGGIYECQISTEPKMSLAYRLNVVGKLKSLSSSLTTKEEV